MGFAIGGLSRTCFGIYSGTPETARTRSRCRSRFRSASPIPIHNQHLNHPRAPTAARKPRDSRGAWCVSSVAGRAVNDLAERRYGGMAVSESNSYPAKRSQQLQLLTAIPPYRRTALPVLDERLRGTRFVSLTPRSVLNSPAQTGMDFWSLNPYVGCEFGCTYCYARYAHRYVVERAHDAGKLNDIEILISLITVDVELIRAFEARSPMPAVRLRAVAKLAAAGLNVGLIVAPVLPGVTDDRRHLEALFRAAREAGARFVYASPLR